MAAIRVGPVGQPFSLRSALTGHRLRPELVRLGEVHVVVSLRRLWGHYLETREQLLHAGQLDASEQRCRGLASGAFRLVEPDQTLEGYRNASRWDLRRSSPEAGSTLVDRPDVRSLPAFKVSRSRRKFGLDCRRDTGAQDHRARGSRGDVRWGRSRSMCPGGGVLDGRI